MTTSDLLALWTEATAAGRLAFPRCAACGAWNWYPMPACRACGASNMRMEEVPARGAVHSWTRVHRAFGGEPVAALPYVVVIVAIDGAPGVRLACLQDEPGDPVIDSPVALRPVEGEKGTGRWLCRGTATTG